MAAVVLSGVCIAGIMFLVWFFIALCTETKHSRTSCVVTVESGDTLSVTHGNWRVYSSTHAPSETEVLLRQPFRSIAGKTSISTDRERSASAYE